MTQTTKKIILVPTLHLPVSWGEVVDKITILEIKCLKLTNEDALANVRKELSLLLTAAEDHLENIPNFNYLKNKLRNVNEALWEIEDKIREKEARQEFDEQFIELARSVYKRNDERASIKKEINKILNSEIIEEKSYKHY